MRAMTILANRRFGIAGEHFRSVHRVFVLVIENALWSAGRIAGIMTPPAVDFLYLFVRDRHDIDMAVDTPLFGMRRVTYNSGVDKQTYFPSRFFCPKEIMPAVADQTFLLS